MTEVSVKTERTAPVDESRGPDAPLVTLRAIRSDNWRAALALTVLPEQLPFISDSPAPVALALAKAFVQPGNMTVTPLGIYAGDQIIGFFALLHEPGRGDRCWIIHFLIDSRHQRRGYGSAALHAIVAMLKEQYPHCQSVNLTVNPSNHAAQHLYRRFGFVETGEEAFGEPWYRLPLEEQDKMPPPPSE
jgi:diamine N-acetyltransferase